MLIYVDQILKKEMQVKNYLKKKKTLYDRHITIL